jgi:hypothetical protein
LRALDCLRDELGVACEVAIGSDVDVPHRDGMNALTTPLRFRLDCVDRSLTRQHPYARSTYVGE